MEDFSRALAVSALKQRVSVPSTAQLKLGVIVILAGIIVLRIYTIWREPKNNSIIAWAVFTTFATNCALTAKCVLQSSLEPSRRFELPSWRSTHLPQHGCVRNSAKNGS